VSCDVIDNFVLFMYDNIDVFKQFKDFDSFSTLTNENDFNFFIYLMRTKKQSIFNNEELKNKNAEIIKRRYNI